MPITSSLMSLLLYCSYTDVSWVTPSAIHKHRYAPSFPLESSFSQVSVKHIRLHSRYSLCSLNCLASTEVQLNYEAVKVKYYCKQDLIDFAEFKFNRLIHEYFFFFFTIFNRFYLCPKKVDGWFTSGVSKMG